RRLHDRIEVRTDVPWRLPRRIAVAEEVERDDVVFGQLGCERREVQAVVPHPVEADDPGRALRAPLVEREGHALAPSVSSESGTSSARYSSFSFTSDQMIVPSRSMRKVPRWGAPFASLKTPYALAVMPCGQQSEAKVKSAPICFFHACRAAGGSHETKTISVPASLNASRFSCRSRASSSQTRANRNGWQTRRTFERPRKSDSRTRSEPLTARSNSGAASP